MNGADDESTHTDASLGLEGADMVVRVYQKDKGELASRVVGIWIRVSTEDQARGESPEHHENRARYYAEARGWRVVEVYRIEGVSGKAVREHPKPSG